MLIFCPAIPEVWVMGLAGAGVNGVVRNRATSRKLGQLSSLPCLVDDADLIDLSEAKAGMVGYMRGAWSKLLVPSKPCPRYMAGSACAIRWLEEVPPASLHLETCIQVRLGIATNNQIGSSKSCLCKGLSVSNTHNLEFATSTYRINGFFWRRF